MEEIEGYQNTTEEEERKEEDTQEGKSVKTNWKEIKQIVYNALVKKRIKRKNKELRQVGPEL